MPDSHPPQYREMVPAQVQYRPSPNATVIDGENHRPAIAERHGLDDERGVEDGRGGAVDRYVVDDLVRDPHWLQSCWASSIIPTPRLPRQ